MDSERSDLRALRSIQLRKADVEWAQRCLLTVGVETLGEQRSVQGQAKDGIAVVVSSDWLLAVELLTRL